MAYDTNINNVAGYSAVDTSVVVDDASGIAINDYGWNDAGELFQVDNIVGDTLTLSRGELGSTAAAMIDGELVRFASSIYTHTENFDSADDGRFIIGQESDIVEIVPAGAGSGHALLKSAGTSINNGTLRLFEKYGKDWNLLRCKVTLYVDETSLPSFMDVVMGFTPNLQGHAKNGNANNMSNFWGARIDNTNERFHICQRGSFNDYSTEDNYTLANTTEFVVEFTLSKESGTTRMNAIFGGQAITAHEEAIATAPDNMRERPLYPFIGTINSFQGSTRKWQVRKFEVWSDVQPVSQESSFETEAAVYIDTSTPEGAPTYTTKGGTTPTTGGGNVRAAIGEIMDFSGTVRMARDIATPPTHLDDQFPADAGGGTVKGVDFGVDGELVTSDSGGNSRSELIVKNDAYMVGIAGKFHSGADVLDSVYFPFADGTTLRFYAEQNGSGWDLKIQHEGTTYDPSVSVGPDENFFIVAYYDGTDLHTWVNSQAITQTDAAVGDLTAASAAIYWPEDGTTKPRFIGNGWAVTHNNWGAFVGGQGDVQVLVDRWYDRYFADAGGALAAKQNDYAYYYGLV